MTTFADLLGIPVDITFEGKTYSLREPDAIERGKFQRWLEQNAKDSARRDLEQSPEELARQINLIIQDSSVGEYEWGGELACKALTKITPITQLFYIVLSKDHPEVTLEFAQRMMDKNVREIVAGLACKAVEDPKWRRAVLASLALPEDYLDFLTQGQSGGESSSSSPTPHSASPPTRSDGSPIPSFSDSTPTSEEKADSPS